ncbi:hypothetical protein [Rhizobium phage RHph_X2_25]|nr:hypothetical protein [Rhizobium phage RHph_X2_25]
MKFTMALPTEGGTTHCGTYETVCDGEGSHVVRVPDIGNLVTVSSQSKIEGAILAERQRCADVVYMAAMDGKTALQAWRDIIGPDGLPSV